MAFAPIDYSSMTGPVPESGTSKGLTFFSNALDAVLQRRQQMEQQKAQQAQAEAHFQQNMAFQREQAQMQEAARVRDDEQAKANAAAQAEQNKQKLALEAQDRQATAIKDTAGMISGGQKSAVPAFLQSRGMTYGPKPIANPELLQQVAQPEQLDFEQGSPEWEAQAQAEAQANDQEMGRQRQLAQQQAAVRGVQTIGFPGGGSHDVDERAMSPEGLQERLAGVVYSDPMDAMAAKRIGAGAGVGGVKPDQVGPLIEADIQGRRRDAAALERARLAAAGARNRRDEGAARIDETKVNNWRTENDKWEDRNEIPALTKSFERIKDLTRRVEDSRRTGSVVDQRSVLFNIAKEISGPGVLTEADLNNTVKNTAGMPAKWATKYATMTEGEMGEAEWAALELFVKNAAVGVKAKAARALRNFDTRYVINPKEHYRKTVPDQVDSYRDGFIHQFDLQHVVDAEKEADAFLGGLPAKAPQKKGKAR